MDARYQIDDVSQICSPALLFYKDLIADNIREMLQLAGRPERLRPHAKTHKTREIAQMQLAAGITKHKCATIAEAELLAAAGVPDVLLAYPIVGPNCRRVAKLLQAYPHTHFAVLADHPVGIGQLAAAMSEGGHTIDVLLDINVGQDRTGVLPDETAVRLYQSIAGRQHLRPGGLHVYDGHNHQERLEDRRTAVAQHLDPVFSFRDRLLKLKLSLPRIVFGGTPTFSVWTKLNLPEAEFSPGTCVLYDAGYGGRFGELPFKPAALLLTRVVSRPTPQRVTFDLGYKAIASDPPAGKRCRLLDVPEYREVLHNEEHLVIETPFAERFQPGDVAFAIPMHVCPTVALHQHAQVIEGGKVVGRWRIAARDRELTV
jgi:D-serine deaminase-like pyridoxal phosphate-dependent protein